MIYAVETKFTEIPDALRRGRPPIPSRTILSGIVYLVAARTSCRAMCLADASSGSRRHSRTTPAPNASSRVAMFSPFIRAGYASALTKRNGAPDFRIRS